MRLSPHPHLTSRARIRTTRIRRAALLRRVWAWRQRGGAALNELLLPRLHEPWTRGDGRLDIHVLPRQYHLVPAVATA